MRNINNAIPKTGTTNYHAQIGLLDKGLTIKGLVFYNSWGLKLKQILKTPQNCTINELYIC